MKGVFIVGLLAFGLFWACESKKSGSSRDKASEYIGGEARGTINTVDQNDVIGN